jgi:hypothetical protein
MQVQKLFSLLLFFTVVNYSHAQFTHKIKADSVRIYNDNCNAEFIVENSTKDIAGFLFNRGNGRTEFRKAVIKLNDTSFIIGGDTLIVKTKDDFLPLTGGTLTGALEGTQSDFTMNYNGLVSTLTLRNINTGVNALNRLRMGSDVSDQHFTIDVRGLNNVDGSQQVSIYNQASANLLLGGWGTTGLTLSQYGNAIFSNSVKAMSFETQGTIGQVSIPGAGSGVINLYGAYSGSPAHPGMVIQNYTGVITFAHNSNGGTTSLNGALWLRDTTNIKQEQLRSYETGERKLLSWNASSGYYEGNTAVQVKTWLGMGSMANQSAGDYYSVTQVNRLFGATTTSGVMDWNHVSNTKPGSGYTLLTGIMDHGPGPNVYYHPFNLEYSSKDGTGNVTQMAVAYGTPGNELWMRGRYDGTWSSWVQFLNSGNIASYALPITGGTLTGQLNGTSAFFSSGLISHGTITASSFNGSGVGLTGIATGLTTGKALGVESGNISDLNQNWVGINQSNRLEVYRYNETAINKPNLVDNANWLMNIYSHGPDGTGTGSGSYGGQLSGINNGSLYYRSVNNGSFSAWKKILNSDNFNEYAMYGPGFSANQNLTTSSNVQFAQLDASLIRSSGDIIAFSTSDKRLKSKIMPIADALTMVKKIGGYSYEWNEQQAIYKGKDYGILAQEVEAIMPEIVQTRDNGYKAVKYDGLIPLLLQAIKELQAKVEKLESNVK